MYLSSTWRYESPAGYVQAHWHGLEQQWKAQMPGWPFQYFFLENDLEKLYKAENKMSKITLIFSGLSILVACLGLFGLSTFTAEQRQKGNEHPQSSGGSGSEIFMLFSKRFFTLILIANAMAIPLGLYSDETMASDLCLPSGY